MYEHTQQDQGRRALPAAADESDARAAARRALQDAYDWRDDENRRAASGSGSAPAAAPSSPSPSSSSPSTAPDERSARAAARRRRQFARSTSRTVAV
jgi:hypothetical protein